MAALLKQLSCIYCTYLWLATLAAVNAQEVLQPNPDEPQILNRDTRGLNFLAEGRNKKNQPNVPKTRCEFLRYSQKFTPDTNTASTDLSLSEENTVITNTGPVQPYPDHPDRFQFWVQVLCRESVRGRSYWEIEVRDGGGVVFIAVSYKSISRKGPNCRFGDNDQSWGLDCHYSGCLFRHNKIETKLPVKSISSRVGVYVDHSAGTLSFYSVDRDTMSLIHTVQTRFTQPLYPGFGIGRGSSVKLLEN